MKIYEIRFVKDGQKAWVCALTVIEALWKYFSITSIDFVDMDITDDVIEIAKEEWPNYHITDDGGNKLQSFEEYMKTAVYADIIAVTED